MNEKKHTTQKRNRLKFKEMESPCQFVQMLLKVEGFRKKVNELCSTSFMRKQ